MSKNSSNPRRFPRFRRIWRPAVAAGAGGTATAVWFEEILLYGEQILALIFLPIMAAVIYLLDHFIFKAQRLDAEDKKNANDKRRS
jgi:hypothetical protein